MADSILMSFGSAWADLPDALSNEENMKLLREYRASGDVSVRDKLVYGNMKLVVYVMRKFFPNIFSTYKNFQRSFEDFAHNAVLTLMTAIDNYKLDSKAKFSTYLTQSIKCSIYDSIKESVKGNDLSLNMLLNEEERRSSQFEDLLEDKSFNYNELDEKLDVKRIKQEIMPYLSKQEKDIFSWFYFDGLSIQNIATLCGISRQRMDMYVKDVIKRVKDMYHYGVSDFDKIAKGARLSQPCREKLEIRREMLERYDFNREFFIKHFIPLLTPYQAELFKVGILDFYGRSWTAIEQDTGFQANDLKAIRKKYDKNIILLDKKYKEFKQNIKPKKISKYAELVNKIIRANNGRLFLSQYLLPILPELERRVFLFGVVDYVDQKVIDIAGKCGLSVDEFKNVLKNVVKKLRTFDMNVVVDLLDRVNSLRGVIPILDEEKIEKIKARRNLVESYGVIRLNDYFLPLLPEDCKKIFVDLYLHPAFVDVEMMAKYYNLDQANVEFKEKMILEKLEKVDFDQIELLQERAEQAICVKGEVSVRQNRASKAIVKYGGKKFLKEVYAKRLTGLSRIVFEMYFLENQPIENVLDELGWGYAQKDEILRIHSINYACLRQYATEHKDFAKKVETYYKEHGYDEVERPQALSCDDKKYTLASIGKCQSMAQRKRFMKQFLSKYGQNRMLVREFLPTIANINYRKVFISSFLEYNSDKNISDEFKLSELQIKTAKLEIFKQLEIFATKDCKKTRNK